MKIPTKKKISYNSYNYNSYNFTVIIILCTIIDAFLSFSFLIVIEIFFLQKINHFSNFSACKF